ncbi:MAG: transglycosylase domain-containing protein, partial [Nitrospira sp.]
MAFNDRFTELRAPDLARWPRWKTLLAATGALAVVGIVMVSAIFWWASQELPPLDQLSEYQPSQVSRVYSDDRQVVGQFYIERRLKVQLADVPQDLINAVIAVEDARFFEHPGLDIIGIG